MRILLFTDHFRPEPSAPAAHVYDRAVAWAADGHDVSVVTSAPNFPDGEVFPGYRNSWRSVEEADGVRVVRVKTYIAPNRGFARRVLDYLSYLVSASLQAWREPEPDVVFSTSPHLFVGIAGVLHALARRRPHVLEVRDLWPASIVATGAMQPGRIYRALEAVERWLYRRSAAVVTLAPGIGADIVRRGIPQAKVHVVVNGADLDLFAPRPPDEELAGSLGLEGRFVVGYLGTLGLAHDLHLVLEAADRLRGAGVTFLFVGSGAARDALVAEAVERGLDDVVFVPRRLKEQMPAYWSICDAALVHLRDDPVFLATVPSKIFEAMAMGLPIVYVAPPGGDGWRLVEELDVGVTVQAGKPADTVSAVERLATDPALRERLAANGLAAVHRYSRRRQAEETLAVLEGVL